MYELNAPASVIVSLNWHAALVRCAAQNTHAQHKTKPKVFCKEFRSSGGAYLAFAAKKKRRERKNEKQLTGKTLQVKEKASEQQIISIHQNGATQAMLQASRRSGWEKNASKKIHSTMVLWWCVGHLNVYNQKTSGTSDTELVQNAKLSVDLALGDIEGIPKHRLKLIPSFLFCTVKRIYCLKVTDNLRSR